MKKILSKLLVVGISMSQLLALSGCSLLRKETDPYVLTAVKAENLEEDVYYVKNGTNFYKTYECPGTADGTAGGTFSDRILWLQDDEALVPTLYKGEVLAYSSSSTLLYEAPLERFKDAGYSFGVYSMQLNDDNETSFDENCVIEGTSARNYWGSDDYDTYRISTINGRSITSDMLGAGLYFNCLEELKEYTVEYFEGTYFKTATVTADTHFLQSFELYSLADVSSTKNGYIEIKMDDDMKSGWYKIGGSGLFKYVAHERDGSPDPEGDELNEPYYTSENKDYSYAQKYSVSFNQDATEATITATVDPTTVDEGGITVFAVGPDGTEYEMQQSASDSSKYYVTMTHVYGGKWYVYIAPKTVTVIDVDVSSSAFSEDSTQVDKEFTFSEDARYQTFSVEYTGEGEIVGYVIDESGETYDLTIDEENKVAYYTMPYVKAGTYTVTVYHNTDTELGEIEVYEGEYKIKEEITSVEG